MKNLLSQKIDRMSLYRRLKRITSENRTIARIDRDINILSQEIRNLRQQRKVEEEKMYQTIPEYREVCDMLRAELEEYRRNRGSIMLPLKRKKIIEELGKIIPTECKDESSVCVICAEFEKSIFFGPCGHVAVCSICAIKILKDKLPCPVCRGQIGTACQVFD